MGYYDHYFDISKTLLDRGKCDRRLQCWYFLTSYLSGSRDYDPSSIREVLGIVFDMEDRNTHNILVHGNKEFWDYVEGKDRTDAGSFTLYSPETVADKIGLKSPGVKIEQKPSDLTDSTMLKAYYLACRAKYKHAASPITRQRFQELTGIQIRVQQIFDANARKISNFILVMRGTKEACEKALGQQGNAKGYTVRRVKIVDDTGNLILHEYCLLKQTGNTYPGSETRKS
ncbi:MAG TPA: hypothetical protein DCL60_03325, partial [Armatimonadetes bacterium]|nr:hypothetical protein [Armatimonadota bacterium]